MGEKHRKEKNQNPRVSPMVGAGVQSNAVVLAVLTLPTTKTFMTTSSAK